MALRYFHRAQKSEIMSEYSFSSRVDTFCCHGPGPGGITLGIDTKNTKEQLSENGHGTVSHADTDGTQVKGQPIRSILEEKLSSALDQVKPEEDG